MISEELKKFVEKQHEESWEDANRAPDASPWRLAQLSGIKNLFKAYNKVRELLLQEYLSKQPLQDLTPEDKNKLEAEFLEALEAKIDEVMK